jgi:hypothetical protein
MHVLHRAAQLKHEFEALAHADSFFCKFTTILLAQPIVVRNDVAVRRILQQDGIVASGSARKPKTP